MKNFIEKLIGRLEGLKTYYAEDFSQGYSCEVDCVEKYEVKKIINQLAEEYKLLENIEQLNNGWIACSERLPEDNTNVIVCFRTGTVKVLRYEDTGIFRGINEYTTRVIIAWMPLPQPYKAGD